MTADEIEVMLQNPETRPADLVHPFQALAFTDRQQFFVPWLRLIIQRGLTPSEIEPLRAVACASDHTSVFRLRTPIFDGALALQTCLLRHPEIFEPLDQAERAETRPDLPAIKALLTPVVAFLKTVRKDKVLIAELDAHLRAWLHRIRDGKGKPSDHNALLVQLETETGAATTSTTGQVITFIDPEPWPKPVDGAQLLDDLVAFVSRFVVMATQAKHALALWVLFTWGFEAFDIAPYLTMQSPTKRCGKTRVMILLKWFCRRALLVSNTSAAPIYRLIPQYGPTMLFDEIDTFMHLHEELQNILNTGHNRETAYVMRTVKPEDGDHAGALFPVYSPKGLALIETSKAPLPSTVVDRSIILPMRRKAKHEACERLGRRAYHKYQVEIETLVRQAHRWTQDHLEGLKEAVPTLPEDLHDRAQDNWEPLLAVADAAGKKWPGRARVAARLLSGSSEEVDDTPSLQALTDIRAVFKPEEKRLPTKLLLNRLQAIDEAPWRSYGKRGEGLTAEQLAKLLRPFKVRPRQVWDGATRQVFRGYFYQDLEPIFALYLEDPLPDEGQEPPSNPLGPLGAQESTDLRPTSDPIVAASLAGSKGGVTPTATTPLAGLAGSTWVNGGVPKDTPRRAPVR